MVHTFEQHMSILAEMGVSKAGLQSLEASVRLGVASATVLGMESFNRNNLPVKETSSHEGIQRGGNTPKTTEGHAH